MYGPLVMATEGISSWEEATVDLDPSLSGVTLNGAAQAADRQGEAYSNLYTMNFNGHTFVPDYYANRHTTHYFRLNLPGTPQQVAGSGEQAVNLTDLNEAMLEAKRRRNDQQRWEALEVKVPEYSPWAKHGFARMMDNLAAAENVLNNPDLSANQNAIDKATANLNAAINSMRPGNLPELEDMDQLLPLLDKAKAVQNPSAELKEAIEYAEMVVKYVSDGSGTLDMIEKATKQLSNHIR